jgi:flagellar motor switch protein FliM
MMIDADAPRFSSAPRSAAIPTSPVAPIQRDLTGIELTMLADLFDVIARTFEGSGERALGISFPLGEVITGSEIPRMPRRDGPAAMLEFRIHSPSAPARSPC